VNIVVVVRPHRSTTYVDTVYCYRPNSVVCLSVCMSVCLSHQMSPAKMAEPIEMPFGLMTWVGPGNHVLDGGPEIPLWELAILRGKGASHCKV